MRRRVHCHWLGVLRRHVSSPLHQKGLISQKPFRSPIPLPYIVDPYDKTHPMTSNGGPWGGGDGGAGEGEKRGACPTRGPPGGGVYPDPPVHIRFNISETVQNPIPRLFIYIVVTCDKTHLLKLTRGHAPHTSLHKRHKVSLSVQIPTRKPCIWLFLMIRQQTGVRQWYASSLQFI